MRLTIMTCECCGRNFVCETGDDGYIDHCVNFSEQFDTIVKKEPHEIFKEICFFGNSLRSLSGAESRLACFSKYCIVTGKENRRLLELVIPLVNTYAEKARKLGEIHDKILELVEPLSESEKELVGLSYGRFNFKWIEEELENENN